MMPTHPATADYEAMEAGLATLHGLARDRAQPMSPTAGPGSDGRLGY